jgi:hypothetical protein
MGVDAVSAMLTMVQLPFDSPSAMRSISPAKQGRRRVLDYAYRRRGAFEAWVAEFRLPEGATAGGFDTWRRRRIVRANGRVVRGYVDGSSWSCLPLGECAPRARRARRPALGSSEAVRC